MKPELAPPLWKEQTCQSCVYRVGNECHRHPPTIMPSGPFYTLTTIYPIVPVGTKACAEWKRDPTEEMQ